MTVQRPSRRPTRVLFGLLNCLPSFRSEALKMNLAPSFGGALSLKPSTGMNWSGVETERNRRTCGCLGAADPLEEATATTPASAAARPRITNFLDMVLPPSEVVVDSVLRAAGG